jgi:acetolactate synthase-1/2/3 large subunit
MPVYDELYKFKDKSSCWFMNRRNTCCTAMQEQLGVGVALQLQAPKQIATGICWMRKSIQLLRVWYYGAGRKHLLGSDAFRKQILLGFRTPVTKWNYQITEARDSRNKGKAFYIARSASRSSFS